MYSPEFLRPNGFKVNRPLKPEERLNELKKGEKIAEFDENLPLYQLSVIQQNSTFAEIVDRDYPIRGVFTTLALLIIVGLSWFLAAITFDTVSRWDAIEEYNREGMRNTLFFAALMVFLFIAFSAYGLFRESFSYTHFPLRLNRKNRKIYIWRRNGEVFSAPWDKTFFYVRCYSKGAVQMGDIVGHILSEDRQTVKDSFTLSSYTSSDATDLRLHWEYFRRFMEDGPAQPYRMLKICLPIAKRRETWWEGFMRLSLLLHGSVIMQIMATPFNLPASLGRVFAMRTSKIPRWPDWVEQECAIAKDDPYVRESGYEAPRETSQAA
ncbi:DUF6708 domain-containing protein [Pseudoduganella sp. R-34]|uniref:DUF6708 domain-containing protein n=1 Tax=Pseudoduganella sp. R-34 TaxID=3404062 RepID=UPI003CFA0DD1